MFLFPDSPLDRIPLQINPLLGEETILNKSIFPCLTSGKGLTDLLKNLAEFNIVFQVLLPNIMTWFVILLYLPLI